VSKKTFVATIIIKAFLISLVAGLTVVQAARANPFGYLPTSPNKDWPTITVESLSYAGNESGIQLNFAVTIPNSWSSSGYLDRNCYVYQINCEIDNQSFFKLDDAVNVNGLTKDAEYNATNFTDLTVGQHILQIIVSSLSLYNPPPLPSNWLDPYCYYSSLTQTVPFTIDAESSIALSSPLPSAVLNSYSVSHYVQNKGGYTSQPISPETTTITLTSTPSTTPSPSLTLTPSSNPTTSTSATLSPPPSLSPTFSPTLTVTPIITLPESPTQQPTIAPSQAAKDIQTENYPPIIIAFLVVVPVALGLLFYFGKRNGVRQ